MVRNGNKPGTPGTIEYTHPSLRAGGPTSSGAQNRRQSDFLAHRITLLGGLEARTAKRLDAIRAAGKDQLAELAVLEAQTRRTSPAMEYMQVKAKAMALVRAEMDQEDADRDMLWTPDRLPNADPEVDAIYVSLQRELLPYQRTVRTLSLLAVQAQLNADLREVIQGDPDPDNPVDPAEWTKLTAAVTKATTGLRYEINALERERTAERLNRVTIKMSSLIDERLEDIRKSSERYFNVKQSVTIAQLEAEVSSLREAHQTAETEAGRSDPSVPNRKPWEIDPDDETEH